MGRLSPEQLISRAIDLLHKARGMLAQTSAHNAVFDLERAIASATFARGAAVQIEKIGASVPKSKRRRGRSSRRQTGPIS